MHMHYYRIYADYNIDMKIEEMQNALDQGRPVYMEHEGPIDDDEVSKEIRELRMERGDSLDDIYGTY